MNKQMCVSKREHNMILSCTFNQMPLFPRPFLRLTTIFMLQLNTTTTRDWGRYEGKLTCSMGQYMFLILIDLSKASPLHYMELTTLRSLTYALYIYITHIYISITCRYFFMKYPVTQIHLSKLGYNFQILTYSRYRSSAAQDHGIRIKLPWYIHKLYKISYQYMAKSCCSVHILPHLLYNESN